MLWQSQKSQWQGKVLHSDGTPILVQFRRNPRAKRFILRIDPKTRSPKLTVPGNAHEDQAFDFVVKNVDWLRAQLSKAQPEIAYGGHLPWDGQDRMLTPGDTRYIEVTADEIKVPAKRDLTQAISQYFRVAARTDMAPRVDYYVERLGEIKPGSWAVSSLRITDTRTRWGSCSNKGVISLNKRLMMAPSWIRDYVCAHEVAHLAQADHSSAFWRLCQRLEPSVDPKDARAFLKQAGPSYFAVPLS